MADSTVPGLSTSVAPSALTTNSWGYVALGGTADRKIDLSLLVPPRIAQTVTALAAGALTTGGTAGAETHSIVLTTDKSTDVNGAASDQKNPQLSDWRIAAGQSVFASETYTDQIMCIGYNVAPNGVRPNTSEPAVGIYIETDYYASAARHNEVYISSVGGSTDANNRPLFFSWVKNTGVLETSQIHAAGTNGTTGFKILAPTGAGEAGGNLWTLSRNDLIGYCHDATANCTFTLGSGGNSTHGGQFNLQYNSATMMSMYSLSSTQVEIDVGAVTCIVLGKGAGGGAAGGFVGIGTSDNSAQLNQAMSGNLTSSIAHRITQKASSTVNLVEYLNSGSTVKFAIDKDFNTIFSAGSASMTQGFPCVPSGAGAAGTPGTTPSGTAPMYVDTTNNKILFYYGGSWKGAVLV